MVPWDRPQFCTPAKLLLVDFSAPAIGATASWLRRKAHILCALHGSAKKLDIPRHHISRAAHQRRKPVVGVRLYARFSFHG
jgi:hypothetical protein